MDNDWEIGFAVKRLLSANVALIAHGRAFSDQVAVGWAQENATERKSKAATRFAVVRRCTSETRPRVSALASILLGVYALTGCATQMSEAECLGADWAAIGVQDGAAGRQLKAFDDRAESCEKFDIAANFDAYRSGRDTGLLEYCQPSIGFLEGMASRAYRGVCPFEFEAGFLANFELGREYTRRVNAYERAIADYEDAVDALDARRFDLQVVSRRLALSDIDADEAESLRRDETSYNAEIEELQEKLPLLEADIDRTRYDLEDIRLILDRRGLTPLL
ncbi:MAG: DUF2799 domain-containing protein [Pseudomonadota bacterium]